jgi:hypothetical protein
MSTPFIARRESRWEYVGECVEHIEEHNCVKGCVWAGDACEILVRVVLEQPVPEIEDDGSTLHCTARISPTGVSL